MKDAVTGASGIAEEKRQLKRLPRKERAQGATTFRGGAKSRPVEQLKNEDGRP